MLLAFKIRPGGCEPIVDEEVLVGSVMDCHFMQEKPQPSLYLVIYSSSRKPAVHNPKRAKMCDSRNLPQCLHVLVNIMFVKNLRDQMEKKKLQHVIAA